MNERAEKKTRSPESAFYDQLKGKKVVLSVNYFDTVVQGTLVWVDRYSIGFAPDTDAWSSDGLTFGLVEGTISLISKHSIVSITGA